MRAVSTESILAISGSGSGFFRFCQASRLLWIRRDFCGMPILVIITVLIQVCFKTCQNHDEIFVLTVFTLSVYQGMRTIWVLKNTGKQVFTLSCHLVPTFMG